MSTKTIKVCDFPIQNGKCGNDGSQPVSVSLGNKRGVADVCNKHAKDVAKAFESIGIPFTIARTSDAKNRKALKTKSGKAFAAADARPWLQEQGLLREGSSGRIARNLLDRYAEAH